MDTNLIIGIVAAVVIVVLLIVWGVVRGKSRKNEVVGRPAETATSPRQAGRAGEEPETVAATVDRQLSAPETEGETASPRSEGERKPVEPTQAAPAKPAAPAYDVPEKSGSRIQRLKAKLSKSSNPFGKALFNILTKDNLSESDWEDVEDTLLLADVGAEASEQLVGELRRDARITGKASPDEVRATLRDNLLDLVGRDTDRRLNVDKPDAHKPGVIIMVGVNGTGKTTTAGKLARLFVSEDKKVVMGAADTFRAAAADQLETWGARVNVPVVRSDKDGADPASVAFEAAARAKEDDADGLITNVPNLPLFAYGTDCCVITLYDPTSRSIGAVHAGWRGTASGIALKAAVSMMSCYGADPYTLRAAIGPSIGKCCFETDSDVADAFFALLDPAMDERIEKRGDKYHIDLKAINRLWLLRAGIDPSRIDVHPDCTKCHPERYWSHRAMGDRRGGMAAMICLTEDAL